MNPTRIFSVFALLLFALMVKAADDAYGDPLPGGAKLRLGTARMRNTLNLVPKTLTPDGKSLAASGSGNVIAYLDPVTGKTTRTIEFKGEFGTLIGFSGDGRRAVCTGFQGAFVVDAESGKIVGSLKRPIPYGENVASLSADGKRLAMGGTKSDKEGPTVVVWDVDGGKQVASVKPVQNQSVMVTLSPDGKRLATWGSHFDPNAKGLPDETKDPNQMCQFWDADSGKELAKGRLSNSYNASPIVFSPDSTLAATSGADGLIQLLDPATGTLKKLLLGRAGIGRSMAFSPDGKKLAASGNDGAVQQWSLADGKRLEMTAPPLAGFYNQQMLRFIDNDRAIMWGTINLLSIVWEVPSGKMLSPNGGHNNNISGIAVTDGGKEVLTAAIDGSVIRWDPATGKERGTFKLKRPQSGFGADAVAEAITFTPNGSLALAADSNGSLGVYDTVSGLQQFVIPGDNNRQSAFSLSPDARTIVQILTSYDVKKFPGRAAVWDLGTTTKIGSVELPEITQPVATVTPDRKTLITAGKKMSDKGMGDFVLTGWELPTGKRLGVFSEASAFGPMYVLATGDNKSAIVATPNGRLLVIDAVTGKQVRKLDTGGQPGQYPALAPVLSPDMKTVAVAHPLEFGPGATAKVVLIDVESGKVKKTLTGPSANPTALAFSPDGKKLFVGSSDTTVLMWELLVE